jgi:hypothetical protein
MYLSAVTPITFRVFHHPERSSDWIRMDGKDLDDLRKADVEGASPHRNAGNGETVQQKLHSDAATTEETKWLQTAQKTIDKKNALTKQKAEAALMVM